MILFFIPSLTILDIVLFWICIPYHLDPNPNWRKMLDSDLPCAHDCFFYVFLECIETDHRMEFKSVMITPMVIKEEDSSAANLEIADQSGQQLSYYKPSPQSAEIAEPSGQLLLSFHNPSAKSAEQSGSQLRFHNPSTKTAEQRGQQLSLHNPSAKNVVTSLSRKKGDFLFFFSLSLIHCFGAVSL